MQVMLPINIVIAHVSKNSHGNSHFWLKKLYRGFSVQGFAINEQSAKYASHISYTESLLNFGAEEKVFVSEISRGPEGPRCLCLIFKRRVFNVTLVLLATVLVVGVGSLKARYFLSKKIEGAECGMLVG